MGIVADQLQGRRGLPWTVPPLHECDRLGRGTQHPFPARFTEGRNDRAPTLAGELVGQNVDLIIAFGNPLIRASQRATETTPIVGLADDMVGSGLAMAPPGRNSKGVSILASELEVIRSKSLHEFVPQARRIGVLADPTTISTRAKLTSAARDLEGPCFIF